jgi:hypothetical protein
MGAMIRLRDVLSILTLEWVAVLVAVPAAAAPDLRAAQGRLEDQLFEGEIDAEDFLAWHLSPGAAMGTARGAAYVGLETFLVEKANGASEWSAMLVLELPLERFARPRGLQASLPTAPIFGAAAREDMGALGTVTEEGIRMDGMAAIIAAPAVGVPAVDGALPRAEIAQTSAPRAERAAPAPAPAPAMVVTTVVARSCVRAALRAMGLADDNRLESIAARARSSSALPELRLRAVRTLGESGRVSLSEDDPSRYVASGAASNVLEARVTFRLDRLLFADEEIVVERARLDRSEQRLRITGKVVQALFEWQKAYALLQDSTLASEDRLTALVREAESSALLDVMTGGWFGAYRAALAARGP